MPLISVVIPCYNHAIYLTECLDSVKQQSFTDWECIIVNDGSTDDTEKTVSELIQNDTRFRYEFKENGGVSSARNLGITLAQGKYILPLDGDDKIGNDYLEEIAKAFHTNPQAKLVYCKADFFGSVNQHWALAEFHYEDFLFQNCIFSAAAFKKEDYLLTAGYDDLMTLGYEDWEFWIQLINKGDLILRIDRVLFFYRQRSNSRNSFLKNEQNHQKMIDYIFHKHKLKYLKLINLTDNMKSIEKAYDRHLHENTFKFSFTYKTFYKIEREIKRFIKRF